MNQSTALKRSHVLTLLLILALILTGCAGSRQSPASRQEVHAGDREIDEALIAPYASGVLRVDQDGITVFWKKPEKIDGYQVWRSYEEDGDYILLAELQEESDSNQEAFIATGFYSDADFDRNAKAVYYRVTTYKDRDGKRYSSEFKKAIKATYRKKLSLSVRSIAMPSGTQRTLSAVKGWDIVKNVAWESKDPSVVTVDKNGTVTAVGPGEATVQCSLGKDERASVTISVDREEEPPLDTGHTRYEQGQDGIWRQLAPGTEGKAVVMLAGDLMCMGGQQNAMYDEQNGHNFNGSYTYVPAVLEHSDLAIGNLETVISSSQSYTKQESRIDGMPNCNAPARYLDAVRYGGFDGLVMANNHNCDADIHGITDTIEQVEKYDFGHTGLFADKSDPRGLIYEVNGIKVGLVAYVGAACHFNGKEKPWGEEVVETMLNYYSREKAERDIRQLRERGAEYVFVYMHWGVTDHFDLKDSQWKQAHELAEIGADYIVGAHPHIIQPYTELKSGAGKIVPCAFSLGDFNGYVNQVSGNLDTILLVVTLERKSDGSVALSDNRYISFFNFKEYNGLDYASIPISDGMNGGLHLEKEKKIRKRIVSIVGKDIRELTEF